MRMRLQKVLAQAGVASRRGSEEMIRAGRVQVNGEVVTAMGVQVDPDRDVVTVDERRVRMPARKRYVKLHKPAGYLSVMRDNRGRPALLDLVPEAEGLHPVGRLDLDSEGLVLLTDDGALTERLAHPRYEHTKEYLALVHHTPRRASLRALRGGIDLPDGRTAEAEVEVVQETRWGRARRGQCWLRIVLHEGRKRQVRRMCDAVGHPVWRLIRVRIGPIELGDLPVGAWSRLSRGEVRSLIAVSAGLGSLAPKPESRHRMSLPSTIAIDGPAASGKSTIGALLAQRLAYVYFDTGVMYRAVTWAALQRGIPIEDEPAIDGLAESLRIEVTQATVNDGRQYTVYVDGQDVTWELRSAEVNRQVSPVSAYPGVRKALVAQQRRIAQQGQIVMVGRDIGTAVLPDADLKIYLDANLEERARRRYLEEAARQPGPDGDSRLQPVAVEHDDPGYQAIYQAMMRRDRIDSSRQASPLRPASDAVIIDTTQMDVDQVLARALELVHGTDDAAQVEARQE